MKRLSHEECWLCDAAGMVSTIGVDGERAWDVCDHIDPYADLEDDDATD